MPTAHLQQGMGRCLASPALLSSPFDPQPQVPNRVPRWTGFDEPWESALYKSQPDTAHVPL